MTKIVKCLAASVWMLLVTLAVIFFAKGIETNYWLGGGLFIVGLVLLFTVCANEVLVKGFVGFVFASVFAVIQGFMLCAFLGEAAQTPEGHLLELCFLAAILILIVVGLISTLFCIKNLETFFFVLMGLTLLTLVAMIVTLFVADAMFAYSVSVFAIFLFTTWIIYDVQEAMQNDTPTWSVAYALYLDGMNIAVNLFDVID